MPRRVFITVAEVSGDRHAAQFVRALKEMEPDVIVEGLGGDYLREAGAVIHHETTRKAAMSWMALGRAMEFRKLLSWTRRHYKRNKIDLHVCVDSSGVNLTFAQIARQAGVPVLYYIAPQLWASRKGRMPKVRKRVSHLACIWRFEESFFRRHGVTATYVGHPLFDELPANRIVDPATKYPHRSPIIGLLPGSRSTDVKHNLPQMLQVADRIKAEHPTVQFFMPTTPATDPIARQMAGHRADVRIELNGTDALVPQCDLCITKSGTSTVHVAAYGVPMIIVYRVHRLLWELIGRWVVKTRTFGMVNLLSPGREQVSPEFVPWFGDVEPVAKKALDYLKYPDLLDQQRQRLSQIIGEIDAPGCARNVANLAIELMKAPPKSMGRAMLTPRTVGKR